MAGPGGEKLTRTVIGDSRLERWDDHPEHRQLNDGLGGCNLSSGYRVVCCFGGIGCNVDHAGIARDHLRGDTVRDDEAPLGHGPPNDLFGI